MRPSELARQAGVSTDMLRHDERKGLLVAARCSNGYRDYPQEALARVRLVQGALALGFSLDELSGLLAEHDRGGAPCQTVRALAAAELEDLDARLRELSALRDELRDLPADWDARLTRRPAEQRGSGWLLVGVAFYLAWSALGPVGPSWSRSSGLAGTRPRSARLGMCRAAGGAGHGRGPMAGARAGCAGGPHPAMPCEE